MATDGMSVDQLKGEVERLNRELSETTKEKLQAAEYGLVVLEEKQQLQQQFEDIESQLDTARSELDTAREALGKHHTSFKRHHESGVHQEEQFLEETAEREENYQMSISDLEQELKSCRAALSRVSEENDRLTKEINETNHQHEQLEIQRKQLRHELREYKVRENRNLGDYAELEDENISLQKQVSVLKQNQVEFESTKHESQRLAGELEDLHMQLDELHGLKGIVERKLEEALGSLAQEREMKHSLKKELDQRITQESMFNLSNLAHLGGLSEGLHLNNHHEDDLDSSTHPALKRIEADFSVSSGKKEQGDTPRTGTVGDILSEIQEKEVGKIERLLEASESEKQELQKALDEAKKLIEDTQKDLMEQKERADELKSTIATVAAMHERQVNLPNDMQVSYDEGLLAEIAGETDPDKRALLELKQNLQHNEKKYSTAMSQIGLLQDEISRLQARNAVTGNPDIQQALAALKKQCDQYEATIKAQDSDYKSATETAARSKEDLSRVQTELGGITEELAQLYHLVCQVTGQTPSRVMLDHANYVRPGRASSEEPSPSGGDDATVKQEVKEGSPSHSSKHDPTSSRSLSDTIVDQVRFLRPAIEHLIDMSQHSSEGRGGEATEGEVTELQEQVVKLKAMLSTKREQIATLRSVLKANKSTAEVALANLKQKYENEKVIVTETMMKLRNELKSLKERMCCNLKRRHRRNPNSKTDNKITPKQNISCQTMQNSDLDAATFASLRAMFAQRCDEYVTQLDEMQRQLSAAEEEKKTLNSLLRMAIQVVMPTYCVVLYGIFNIVFNNPSPSSL